MSTPKPPKTLRLPTVLSLRGNDIVHRPRGNDGTLDPDAVFNRHLKEKEKL